LPRLTHHCPRAVAAILSWIVVMGVLLGVAPVSFANQLDVSAVDLIVEAELTQGEPSPSGPLFQDGLAQHGPELLVEESESEEGESDGEAPLTATVQDAGVDPLGSVLLGASDASAPTCWTADDAGARLARVHPARGPPTA